MYNILQIYICRCEPFANKSRFTLCTLNLTVYYDKRQKP